MIAPKIKIKSFELNSFRSCLDTRLELNSKLTALIGINGAGKSNILNGILLLKKLFDTYERRYFAILEKKLFLDKDASSLRVEIDYDGKILPIKAKVKLETDERNRERVGDSLIEWNLKNFTGSDEWIELPTNFLSYANMHSSRKEHNVLFQQTLFGVDERLSGIISNNITIFNEVIKFFSNISYYSATRFSNPEMCPNFIEIDEDGDLRPRISSSKHDQFILDLYNLNNSKSYKYDNYLDTVNNKGIGLIDKISFRRVATSTSSYQVYSGGKLKKIEKNRFLIIPNFIIDGNKLSPNQLSEGTLRTLGLIFYILNDESKLLLIEEPEVCVHHGLLNNIIGLIMSVSRNKQVIISTHSDYILDHLQPENLILIKKDKLKGTQAFQLNELLNKKEFGALKTYLADSGNLGEFWKEGGMD